MQIERTHFLLFCNGSLKYLPQDIDLRVLSRLPGGPACLPGIKGAAASAGMNVYR